MLKTKLTATGIEDWIYQTYGRCIVYGAIGMLTSIPTKNGQAQSYQFTQMSC